MYELKKTVKVFTSKFVGTGPSSYEKRICRAAILQRLRNTGVEKVKTHILCSIPPPPPSKNVLFMRECERI
jgi:hypothetical protein